MNVVGLHRQLENGPTLLLTLVLDEGLAILRDLPNQNGLAPLGSPYQVKNH
jgi:hypothetical protein